ncbi:MAG: sigma-70 family RNA polymerase sigma factor [Lachnospiraceae bacterium]|nr:sigma-70 family RNA polymerase sigma factor [Lachnospiraceae bacterium]
MAGRGDFLSELEELRRIGETNDNQLNMDEIDQYFEDMKLSDTQLDSICQFLERKGIVINDRISRGEEELFEEEIETKDDPQDDDMVKEYLREMESTSKVGSDEENLIIRNLLDGDETARTMLIEANLNYAVEIAKEFKGKGLLMSDLIQEANIGLMEAVNDFEPAIHHNFHQYAGDSIRGHIKETLEEYNQSTRSAKKLASRVNELNDLATSFAKEYEREATPKELADRMGITVDEVKELMKVSLDAVAVLNRAKFQDDLSE